MTHDAILFTNKEHAIAPSSGSKSITSLPIWLTVIARRRTDSLAALRANRQRSTTGSESYNSTSTPEIRDKMVNKYRRYMK